MPTMIAALGLSQLKKIQEIILKRREIADYYRKKLKEVKSISLPNNPKDLFHIYQMFTIQLENKEMRDKLMKYLGKKGISTKVYFNPIHLTQFYTKRFRFKQGYLSRTEKVSGRVLSLPIYPDLSFREIDYIIKAIKDFMGRKNNARR